MRETLRLRIRLFSLVLIAAAASAPAAAAGEKSPPRAPERRGVLRFLEERGARRIEGVPRKVLAFYYTWYGRPERHGRWVHWERVRPEAHDIASSTHYPALGAYDSHDPATIDAHIAQAMEHGLDGFIATWWGRGTFDDRAFAAVLERAKGKDFALTVYWETAPGSGREKVERAAGDIAYLVETYGSHPNFLKVSGKPVIFVYGRVMGEVGLAEWREILAEAERRCPGGFLLIADGYSDANARAFDGIHTYNICGWVAGKSPEELRTASRESFRDAVALARRAGKISCLTVIPGYDDTKIRKPGLKADRLGGAAYRILWEEAIAADPDWILVTSWNEWHEGSEIEPSWEDGDAYLRATLPLARRFKESPRGPRAPVEPAPFASGSPEARSLREALRGLTVGVLPDAVGPAPLWLLDAGVDIAELAWEDLAEPGAVTAARYPILLYAGYESYRPSVRERGDVDAGLIRYLEGGGLLLSLSAGPYPFFSDEEGRPLAAASRLGFPMGASGPEAERVRGWESPPEGLELRFEIDARTLVGLPERVPFPAHGDLRWRPASRSSPAGIAEDDVYLPLARLLDPEGRTYGDGIVYVEHRLSRPRGGKNLYVWMRFADIVDPRRLLPAVFGLAAERIRR